MPSEALSGIYVPTLLPLDASQRIDLDSFARHLEYLIASRVHGIWVNGTSGEFHALTDDEQIRVVRTAAECSRGRVPVVAHVGDTATRLVIDKARRAIAAGAAYVSVIPPYYLEFSEFELMRHFRLVAQAIGAPVLLYQHPATRTNAVTIPTLLELAREGVVTGLKDSSTDLEYFRELTEAARRAHLNLRCFHGAGATALATLSFGGDGLISLISNVVPQWCVRLRAEVMATRMTAASATQERVNALSSAIALSLAERSNWAPAIAAYKWLLKEMGIIANDAVFEPLLPLSQREVELLRGHALPVARALWDALPRPKPAAAAADGPPGRFVPDAKAEES